MPRARNRKPVNMLQVARLQMAKREKVGNTILEERATTDATEERKVEEDNIPEHSRITQERKTGKASRRNRV